MEQREFYIYHQVEGKVTPGPSEKKTTDTDVEPVVMRGYSLGDALNNYLASQNTSRPSLNGFNLSPDKGETVDITELSLNRYDYIDMEDCNLSGVSFAGKTINNVSFAGSNLNKSDFSNTHMTNINFNATTQNGTKFKSAVIDNFIAQNVRGSLNDFSKAKFSINQDYQGDPVFDYSDIDDVTGMSTWSDSTSDDMKVDPPGLMKALNFVRREGNVLDFVSSAKKIPVTAFAGAKPVGAAVVASGFYSECVHQFASVPVAKDVVSTLETTALHSAGYIPTSIVDMAKTGVNVVSSIPEEPWHIATKLITAEAQHPFIAKIFGALGSTSFASGAAVTDLGYVELGVVTVASVIAAGIVSKKLEKFMGDHKTEIREKVFSKVASEESRLKSGMQNMKSFFKKSFHKVLHGSDSVLSDDIIHAIGKGNYGRLSYGNNEIVVTDDEGAQKAVTKLLAANQDARPLIINTNNQGKDVPSVMVTLPEGGRIAAWIDHENKSVTKTVLYNHGNIVKINGEDVKPEQDVHGLEYKDVVQSMITGMSSHESNLRYMFKDVKYNTDTHRCVIHGNKAWVINKETGVLDNPDDYALLSYDTDTNKIRYVEMHNGTKVSSDSIILGEERPHIGNNTNDNVEAGLQQGNGMSR